MNKIVFTKNISNFVFMNGGWNNKDSSMPANIDKIISMARVNNCWIYIESKRTFYTPDELNELWTQVYSSGNKTNNSKDFKIVTPLFAVRMVAQWVDIANKKQQEVILKLKDYKAEYSKT